jgi:hypothetical protein
VITRLWIWAIGRPGLFEIHLYGRWQLFKRNGWQWKVPKQYHRFRDGDLWRYFEIYPQASRSGSCMWHTSSNRIGSQPHSLVGVPPPPPPPLLLRAHLPVWVAEARLACISTVTSTQFGPDLKSLIAHVNATSLSMDCSVYTLVVITICQLDSRASICYLV